LIPYGRQSISEADVEAVVNILRSDFLTQGPAIPAFEEGIAQYCGVDHAVAVNSATSALHIACLALGVGPGDCVWTSPVTFVASANCALYCGAKVDFIDIDPATYNLSIEALSEKLERAAREGGLPKLVIPVHMAGQPCDMAAIKALGDRYGFRIIEDASHAVGALYRGQPVGGCQFSDITVFSFHPVKIITTIEGGVALTQNPELAKRMELLRSHGVTRDAAQMEDEPHGQWYYEQVDLGFNYRMTDVQAALGSSQLKRLDSFIERRRYLASRYDEALSGLPLSKPWQHPDTASSYHLYIVRLYASVDRGKAFDRLRELGIGVNVHYMPVYLQPYYRRLGFRPGYCPAAELYYQGAISLPLFPDLSEANQDKVIGAVEAALAP
jgi:UDP-4-amino-4,6-dideoxy-N-acetyl-beta-L-altrosamine transaminase